MMLLQDLNQKGATIAMVTHSMECAKYAQRVLKMKDGMIAGDTAA